MSVNSARIILLNNRAVAIPVQFFSEHFGPNCEGHSQQHFCLLCCSLDNCYLHRNYSEDYQRVDRNKHPDDDGLENCCLSGRGF